jgi:hypothetical protein
MWRGAWLGSVDTGTNEEPKTNCPIEPQTTEKATGDGDDCRNHWDHWAHCKDLGTSLEPHGPLSKFILVSSNHFWNSGQ